MANCAAKLLDNPDFIKTALLMVLVKLAAKHRITPQQVWREHRFEVFGSIFMMAYCIAQRQILRDRQKDYAEIVDYFTPAPNRVPIKHSLGSVMACEAFNKVCHLEAVRVHATEAGLTVSQVVRLYIAGDAETKDCVKLQVYRRCISFAEAVNRDRGFSAKQASQAVGLGTATAKPKRPLRLSTILLMLVLLTLLLWLFK